MTRIILVLLASLVLFPTAAQAQARSRYGMVLYDPPAGWTATDKDDLHLLTAPGRNSFLVFLPAKPLDSTLDKAAAELLSPEKARPGYAEGSTRISGRHNGSGGQWLAITYLYADPNHRGQYLSNWLVLIAGGGQFATLTLISTNSTAFNTDDKAVRRLIDGIKLTTMIQVEPGNPPLTRYLLDETNDFLEWLMQVPLTDAQKATIEREIRGIWRKNDRKEMDGVYEVLKGRQQLAALQPAQRDLVRQSALDDVIKQWRAEKNSPAAKMMVEIYDTAHKPIAAGTPPLTRQNVDAFTEFLCFTAGQTAGVNFTPSAEARDKLAAAVAENYAGMAPSQRALNRPYASDLGFTARAMAADFRCRKEAVCRYLEKGPATRRTRPTIPGRSRLIRSGSSDIPGRGAVPDCGAIAGLDAIPGRIGAPPRNQGLTCAVADANGPAEDHLQHHVEYHAHTARNQHDYRQ